ncbi:hypothetical protein DFJ73DRAFT_801113 [Zopfochytrium polystomum]|nr:hypothetical protein DFJ73DRAFT_801113 [Zopfochytrium polystomum]
MRLSLQLFFLVVGLMLFIGHHQRVSAVPQGSGSAPHHASAPPAAGRKRRVEHHRSSPITSDPIVDKVVKISKDRHDEIVQKRIDAREKYDARLKVNLGTIPESKLENKKPSR